MPLPLALGWTLAVLAMLALPHLLPLPFAVLPGRAGITARSHFAALGADVRAALAQILLTIAFLPDTAQRMADAILRTVWRLGVSRRNLLEWITAAQTARGNRPGILAQYRGMAWGVGLGLGASGAGLVLNPAVWPLILPFTLLWLASPVIAHWISRPAAPHRGAALTSIRCPGSAADRPKHMALFRDVRDRGRQLPAPRQLSGNAQTRAGAPHLSDQHRDVSAVRHRGT
jgi:cyclic beta-1,2-glucan synthetase